MPQLEITAMTFGPYGIGRLDGKTVMAPNCAPGDVLEVAITSERRDYALARTIAVIGPGPRAAFRRARFCRAVADVTGSRSHIPRSWGSRPRSSRRSSGARSAWRLIPQTWLKRRRRSSAIARGFASRPERTASSDSISSAAIDWSRSTAAWWPSRAVRIPHRLAAALGRNLDEIEVVAQRRPRSSDRASGARAAGRRRSAARASVIEADREIAGIVLRGAGRAR